MAACSVQSWGIPRLVHRPNVSTLGTSLCIGRVQARSPLLLVLLISRLMFGSYQAAPEAPPLETVGWWEARADRALVALRRSLLKPLGMLNTQSLSVAAVPVPVAAPPMASPDLPGILRPSRSTVVPHLRVPVAAVVGMALAAVMPVAPAVAAVGTAQARAVPLLRVKAIPAAPVAAHQAAVVEAAARAQSAAMVVLAPPEPVAMVVLVELTITQTGQQAVTVSGFGLAAAAAAGRLTVLAVTAVLAVVPLAQPRVVGPVRVLPLIPAAAAVQGDTTLASVEPVVLAA